MFNEWREFCMDFHLFEESGMTKYRILTITLIVMMVTSVQIRLYGQENDRKPFEIVMSYLASGDISGLESRLADNIELSLFADTWTISNTQAGRIMRSFFNQYPPRSVEIIHIASERNLKYALGTMVAGGEIFKITIFISLVNSQYKVQLLKIERD